MDKKLNRTIGYIKPTSAVKITPAKNTEVINPEIQTTEIDLAAIIETAKIKTKKVVKWINDHEEFKWGVMCTKLGIDRGNFQRTLNSDEPNIKIELVLQIENFLTAYGYAK